MNVINLTATCCALLLALPCFGARQALVIGNAAYRDMPLKNPANDAIDMATRLTELGFSVLHKENLRKTEVGKLLREFGSRLNAGDEVVVFYAGHGLQVKGINYLPAVDADIESEDDVPLNSINLNQLLERLEESKAGIKLVFLDACRNNPYARSFRSAERGLQRLGSAPSGTLITFATRPGSVAADGDGRNGVFTTHLLKHLDAPVPVELMLKQVAAAVEDATQGKQEPWIEGSIKGDFFFAQSPKEKAGFLRKTDLEQKSGPRTAEEKSSLDSANSKYDFTGLFEEPAAQRPPYDYEALLAQVRLMARADQGDAEAQFRLGNEYAELGDDTKAVPLYQKAALQGNRDAQYWLAGHYRYGLGVQRDFAKADQWLVKAAENGQLDAQVSLGLLYAIGDGRPRDLARAAKWYRAAATSGDPRAQLRLAQMYEKGHGVRKDASKARDLYTQAAAQGDPAAQYAIGSMYAEGRGGPKVVAQAIRWYELSAAQGHVPASMKLASMYALGDSIPKNDVKATEWYQMAAVNGESAAQMILAYRYAAGRGVTLDRVLAYAWFNVAGSQGIKLAVTEREDLGRQMSADEVLEAQRLSASWKKGSTIQR